MAAILNWSNILANTGLVATFADEASLEIGLNELVLPPLFTVKTKGAKFIMVGLDGSIRSPEAQDAIDRWTNPTAAMEDALAVFVDAEVANGNWGTNASNYTDSLYDCFWLFGGVNSDVNALADLHQVLKLTAINNLAVRTSDGWTFDGTGQHVDTTYNPNTSGVNLSLNDALFGLFVKDIVSPSTDQFIAGASQGSPRFKFRNQVTNIVHPINSSITSGDSSGGIVDDTLYVSSRITSTSIRLFKDGVGGSVSTNVTNSVTNANVFLGKVNGFEALFFDGTLSACILGGGVGFDQSGFNTNLRTMLTSLGVLP